MQCIMSSSREKNFLEQLEDDFHLEVIDDARRVEPLPASKDLGTGAASDIIATGQDVYLLLGSRRPNRTDQDRHSPLEEWRRQLC